MAAQGDAFKWAQQLSHENDPKKNLPTLLACLNHLHGQSAASLPAILKDELARLLQDSDVPPTFRLASVSIARIVTPGSPTLVRAITTDLGGSEDAACVAGAAAALATLPGKPLLEFLARDTSHDDDAGMWDWCVRCLWCGVCCVRACGRECVCFVWE